MERRRDHDQAEVAELADAHGSGPCTRKGVGVQIPSSAPDFLKMSSSARAMYADQISNVPGIAAPPPARCGRNLECRSHGTHCPPALILQSSPATPRSVQLVPGVPRHIAASPAATATPGKNLAAH